MTEFRDEWERELFADVDRMISEYSANYKPEQDNSISQWSANYKGPQIKHEQPRVESQAAQAKPPSRTIQRFSPTAVNPIAQNKLKNAVQKLQKKADNFKFVVQFKDQEKDRFGRFKNSQAPKGLGNKRKK